jgi:ABC-type polysaccharide/polyol phosphate transport system ATPase subunit
VSAAANFSEVSLVLENVSVEFHILNAAGRSLKKHLVRASSGGRMSMESGRMVVQALRDVSLALERGDRLGVVGHNGAGKTTLLRAMAGVYEPLQGTLRLRGRVIPLFDVGLGIDPEATGYENIYLRGALLGMTRRELDAARDEIAEFTELGDYLGMPVRTYSSGMTLRLAFGISTCVSPDILLLDEFLAAGDANFIKKAEERMNQMIRRAGIMVLASHSPELVERLCNRAVWMHGGQIRASGSPQAVLAEYARGA